MQKRLPVFFSILLIFCFTTFTNSQPCDPGAGVDLKVIIGTDPYPWETSWEVVGIDGTVYAYVDLDATYSENTEYSWELCIPFGACVNFNIYDSYNDGLEFPGFFALELDGVEVTHQTFSDDVATYSLNCPPGTACTAAEPVSVGQHQANIDNAWYVFVPDSTGLYEISTCMLDTCDTKIWVFEDCSTAHNNENNEGTIAYDDNYGGCGEQAHISIGLIAAVPIYIRIGDDQDGCAGDAIAWEIIYQGPVAGCTDTTSCNYNPAATVDDGSCIPHGSPDCPNAPDLLVRQDILVSSAYLSQIEATDPCLVEEGCLNGYGVRDIIRFSTYIENIGDADYFIGAPGPNNPQFTFDNCHNHWHYDGYAEYLLFDANGHEIPVGFKNGFCVIDLGCSSGTQKYTCNYMGITAGCFDEYDAGLQCQWIDITDIPDGRYTFVTRVNWDNAPDALGRKETDTLNNWAQMCIVLDRSSGMVQFTQDEHCDDFIDCNGEVFGNAQYDCEGVCEGTAVWGDLDDNGAQSTPDATAYLDGILQQNLPATSCNDLSGDGSISVYDAALMADCAIYGADYTPPTGGVENHCEFPRFLLNPNHTAGLTILDYDEANQYFDIGIKSITANIVAYQFYMSGLTITGVENLVDPGIYPTTPQFGNDNVVLGLSLIDSVILRSNDWQPLVRVYHDGNLDNEICVSSNHEMVNENYELIGRYLEDNCVIISSTQLLNDRLAVKIQPNPFSENAVLTFSNPEGAEFELRITDVSGKIIQSISGITDDRVTIEGDHLTNGLYMYQLIGEAGTAVGKLMFIQ